MKEKRFLVSFTTIFLVLLAVVLILVGITYYMSVNALENEIQNIYQNSTYDLQVRLEEVLQHSNFLANYLINDDTIRLFFSHPEPDTLVSRYFSIVNTKLNSHVLTYIDSIYLYAPNYQNIVSSQSGGRSYHIDTIMTELPSSDMSWLYTVQKMGPRDSLIYERARNNNWPYYFTVIRKWSSGGVDGVVVLNINMSKLFDHIISENNHLTDVYVVNEHDLVVMQEEKKALTVPVTSFPQLDKYQGKTAFSTMINSDGKHYVYAQSYSEKFKLTSVTITPVNDYYGQLKNVQQTISAVFVSAFFVALAIALIYSYRMIKPIKDIQRLLDSPTELEHDAENYDESIRDLAEQLISHLQTNKRLREELDSRLDLLNDTKILALQAQINPHFLFNTMNAIRLTVESDCGNEHPGVLMLDELSFVLRYCLSDINVVPIREELKFIKEYIAIMNHRYGQIETEIHVHDDALECMIPKLVFQPLVENSIQHGLVPCMGVQSTKLFINVTRLDHTYVNGTKLPSVCIEIRDNGIGMTAEALDKLYKSIHDYNKISREHIGLANVSHRFHLMFHNEQDIQLESQEGQGTTVRVYFPANKSEDP